MKAKPNIIKTNRLILKDISLIDQESFIDIICNEEVSLTYMVPTFKDKQEIINLFNRFIKLSNDENRFVYGIYLNNKLIGLINDVEINNDEIELGYVISPIYKNNGYATEVLSNCINTLFDIGYKVVKTGAFKENKASIKVMEKCNMIKTNVIDKITYKGIEHKCVNYIIKK
jgi:ribosomal-protein-alanine N-acetyltransferase